MRLFRIQIRNYRNFQALDCRLGTHVVLLGENGVGKSNLLRALRLVLDPELPDSDRCLEAEDFWVGVKPFAGNEIVVTVDLTDYTGESGVLACLGDYEVAPPEGWNEPVARLTYRYGPRSTLETEKLAGATKDDYDFAIYGRDDPANEVGRDVRRFLVFKLLHALRDAETDLRAWRKSPLRPLLEEIAPTIDPTVLTTAAAGVDSATGAITSQKPLVDLRDRIGDRVDELIGKQHRLVPTFGFTSTDPTQILHSLRLFVDSQRRWGVADTSLGLANVLYLALLLIHSRQQEEGNQIAAMVLGIEEPEAHLHPQMQRQVFRDLLRRKRPILVSTHSPNIASVAPIESLVVLRTEGATTNVKSFADATGFSDQERSDLAHYLDVTRAEILFGRGIILVEGDAEKFIVPAAAQLFNPPIQLDDYGVSVCSVAGTDFVPYAKLLEYFDIPYVVITDGDSTDATTGAESAGIERSLRLLRALGKPRAAIRAHLDKGAVAKAAGAFATEGLFVGERTLETDMLNAGAGDRMAAAFKDIRPKTKDSTLGPFGLAGAVNDVAEEQLIELIERVGKGRFAQRLASSIVTTDVPKHIRTAIQSIISRVANAP